MTDTNSVFTGFLEHKMLFSRIIEDKYFYTDGYGKDFYVYNLSEKSFQEKFRDLILTGNLLSFFEQILLFENHKEGLREYLIEKPLWAFIGSKVSGAGINSDVLKVVKFLRDVIEDKKSLKENIEKILNGKSGLVDPQGNDIFKDRFERIRHDGFKIDDIWEKIFNSKTGLLSLYELKSAEGEIGLKIGEGDYFGVINIGDVTSFKKLLAEGGFEVKPDSITPSLFEKVNEFNSNINILIGAKKFIEGWDSWRVCSMGLINMGKGEGPQIIQLFGRGVRLKGRNFSLKRSEEKKYHVKALETLNIFGLNADYINTFLEAIRREEVEYEEIQLPLKFMDKKKWEKLYILQPPENFDFTKQFIWLQMEGDLLNKVKIDIRPRLGLFRGEELKGSGEEKGKVHYATGEKVVLEGKYIDLLNWDEIYLEILNYKIARGYGNLGIDKGILLDIIKSDGYGLDAFPDQITPKGFFDLKKLHEIVLIILKSYIDQFYNFNLRQEESKRLRPIYLVRDHENLAYGNYTLKIPKDEKEEIQKIKQLLKQAERFYRDDLEEIPTIHFDQHLYTPLVIYGKGKDYIKSVPPRLNEGETEFVKRLRDYLKANREEFKGEEIFLLRNLSKRGVKFFQTSGYYPDFIIWKRQKDKQTITFIDPKGIRNSGNFNDDKIQLYKNIKDIGQNIKDPKVRLESFILSISKYNDIKKTFEDGRRPKEDFEKNHILFMEDKDSIAKLLKIGAID